MEIRIESLIEGARRATGAVAVIDVFRAFTTAAVALAGGAARIVMVATVEEALSLRESGMGQVCMGEVDGRVPPGFDFGNSPFELSRADLKGKTIIQRIGAGTQGIVAAKQAERLYAAALVTAKATARALLSGSPERIALVAMGNNAVVRDRRGRIVRHPPAQSSGGQARRCSCPAPAHSGGRRNCAFPRSDVPLSASR